MKKRIFGFMSLIILLTVFLLTASFGIAFQSQFKAQISEGLKTVRVTIISESGDILFDNFADPKTLENHSSRPEVADAMQHGFGRSERYSDTLGEQTNYYAMRLNDSSVLRVALTTSSIYSLMYRFVPLAVMCLLLVLPMSFAMANRLTKRIIRPINDMDPGNPDVFVYDELSPFIRKINRQKQEIASQLSEINERAGTIKTITDNMREGLIMVDSRGVILSSNTGAMEIFGEDCIAGKNLLHVWRDMELFHNMRQCLAGDNSEMLFEREGRTYNIYLSPVINNASVNGAIVFLLDTTEKYKSEKQRKEFSANVSHELKTPLTTIAALSEMIGNGMAKPEDVQGFAVKISEHSGRLINMIDDIIRLSEFDEGNISIDYSCFDLHSLTQTVSAGLRDKADHKNVRLIITVQGSDRAVGSESFTELWITANRRMIDELLFNLIENAIKYNKDGGEVLINLTGPAKASDPVGLYKISVSDTGIGIPKKHHSRVFERFYRVDKSRVRQTASGAAGGTGLGLSIVKHIVEYHNGQIEMISEEGVGTTITCYIRAK